MSEPQRVEGSRVYCHSCDHEWDRAHGGLQCPACQSDFVEIVEPNSRRRSESPPALPSHPQSPHPPLSPNPFHDHNPWAPDPGEDDITTFEFNSGGGRGTFSISSRTYTFGGGNLTSRDTAADEIHHNFETMLGSIMGFHPRRQTTMPGRFYDTPSNRHDRGFGGTQPGQQPGQPPDLFSMLFPNPGQPRADNQLPNAFDLLGAMLNPAMARRGDTVFSQEAFDRIMTQLMEQNSSGAPGPASDAAIAALKKKPVDAEMLGNEGKAECSICMDNLQLGDEVTVLPCNHWFHGGCVISWLREHDTCPHCRKPITNAENASTNTNGPSSSSSSRRRRSSRRSSSVASPLNPIGEDNGINTQLPDTPSGLREARQRYYGGPRSPDFGTDRPVRERRSSSRSQRSADNNGNNSNGGGGGGVTGWIRNRLQF